MHRILTTWALTPLAVLTACTGATPEAAPSSTRAAPSASAFASDRITVEVRGAGPDVILIPGLTSSRRIWESTVNAVPGYRYHLVQLNGFAGEPARGNARGLVVGPASEEIARYVRESGLRRPALVGHSMGGAIALMIAARHPDAAGRAMVVDMLPFPGVMLGPPGSTLESLRQTADRRRDQMQGANAIAWAIGAQQNMASMVKTEGLRAGPVRDAQTSDREVAARAMHELLITDLRPELGAIAAPVSVLYVRPPTAAIDEAQMEALYRMSYANLKGATLTRVPDAYHFIMLDQPERFAAEMKRFLAGS